MARIGPASRSTYNVSEDHQSERKVRAGEAVCVDGDE